MTMTTLDTLCNRFPLNEGISGEIERLRSGEVTQSQRLMAVGWISGYLSARCDDGEISIDELIDAIGEVHRLTGVPILEALLKPSPRRRKRPVLRLVE